MLCATATQWRVQLHAAGSQLLLSTLECLLLRCLHSAAQCCSWLV